MTGPAAPPPPPPPQLGAGAPSSPQGPIPMTEAGYTQLLAAFKDYRKFLKDIYDVTKKTADTPYALFYKLNMLETSTLNLQKKLNELSEILSDLESPTGKSGRPKEEDLLKDLDSVKKQLQTTLPNMNTSLTELTKVFSTFSKKCDDGAAIFVLPSMEGFDCTSIPSLKTFLTDHQTAIDGPKEKIETLSKDFAAAVDPKEIKALANAIEQEVVLINTEIKNVHRDFEPLSENLDALQTKLSKRKPNTIAAPVVKGAGTPAKPKTTDDEALARANEKIMQFQKITSFQGVFYRKEIGLIADHYNEHEQNKSFIFKVGYDRLSISGKTLALQEIEINIQGVLSGFFKTGISKTALLNKPGANNNPRLTLTEALLAALKDPDFLNRQANAALINLNGKQYRCYSKEDKIALAPHTTAFNAFSNQIIEAEKCLKSDPLGEPHLQTIQAIKQLLQDMHTQLLEAANNEENDVPSKTLTSALEKFKKSQETAQNHYRSLEPIIQEIKRQQAERARQQAEEAKRLQEEQERLAKEAQEAEKTRIRTEIQALRTKLSGNDLSEEERETLEDELVRLRDELKGLDHKKPTTKQPIVASTPANINEPPNNPSVTSTPPQAPTPPPQPGTGAAAGSGSGTSTPTTPTVPGVTPPPASGSTTPTTLTPPASGSTTPVTPTPPASGSTTPVTPTPSASGSTTPATPTPLSTPANGASSPNGSSSNLSSLSQNSNDQTEHVKTAIRQIIETYAEKIAQKAVPATTWWQKVKKRARDAFVEHYTAKYVSQIKSKKTAQLHISFFERFALPNKNEFKKKVQEAADHAASDTFKKKVILPTKSTILTALEKQRHAIKEQYKKETKEAKKQNSRQRKL